MKSEGGKQIQKDCMGIKVDVGWECAVLWLIRAYISHICNILKYTVKAT